MPFQVPSIPFEPIADPAAVVSGPHVRITVLTSRLLRLEYSPDNQFEDRPSQVFWYRKQPVPAFQVSQDQEKLHIDTGALQLTYLYSPDGFTADSLEIKVLSTQADWHFGDRDWQNLSGTGRTLDGADGPIRLESGLLSRSGWSLVDDSHTLVFDSAGWLTPRPAQAGAKNQDLYFFGYGHAYIECLQDYFKVAGSVPLVPRWILGNWMSRYWEYTQAELTELMEQFKQRQVPLAVCIIDMDWHITRTGNKSSGWTGYTWNKELFPDPAGFLSWLHSAMNLRTAMNLHPADGVWPHEAMYPQMAKAMGVPPGSGKPVSFDIADPEFARHYFEILHHPYEEMGVDFWWMDWQQGVRISRSRSSLAAHLDPLWWLNHLHYYDLGRAGAKRSFIFSRWGGLGNHRYPIGFSGDSIVSWKSLAFQPYFTATAGNVAFGWWSHDIGGHMGGMEDAELYTRWVQYGVFSPILRLHSTKNAFQDRSPWAFGEDIFQVARSALQLRHALIPYIYSMAWRFSRSAVPLCAPLYYRWPEVEEAYHCPNQYLFGDQLLAAPFTTPRSPDTSLSRASVWFPEGNWFNFFSGELLTGPAWHTVYGSLNEIPIFAKAGAMVPLAPAVGWDGVDLPEELAIHIFPGANGEFELYEDDGVSGAYQAGKSSLLRMTQSWSSRQQVFDLLPVSGDLAHLPAERAVRLVFHAVRQPDALEVLQNGKPLDIQPQWDAKNARLALPVIRLAPTDRLTVRLTVSEGELLLNPDRRAEKISQRLYHFRLDSNVKQQIERSLPRLLADPNLLGRWNHQLTDAQAAALQHMLQGEA